MQGLLCEGQLSDCNLFRRQQAEAILTADPWTAIMDQSILCTQVVCMLGVMNCAPKSLCISW